MKKSYLISIFLSLVVIVFYIFSVNDGDFSLASKVYRVYLSGNEIGTIANEDELYNIINEKQKNIKKKYNVDNVYPPNDLEVIQVYAYDDKISSVNDIYNKVESVNNFTIKGYEITIKYTEIEGEKKEDLKINVLDKKLFDKVLDDFVHAFIDSKMYADYMNGEQESLVDAGEIVDDMYFREKISVKESFISVNDVIFTDEQELLKYLIFGDSNELLSYTVKKGDTIPTIAYNNKLSVAEFLVGNPSYRNEETMLQIGDTLNVTFPTPLISFVYQMTKLKEIENDFINTNVYDKTKASNYKEITTPGVTGLEQVTLQYNVINGVDSQEVVKLSSKVLRETVNQVTTLGATGGGNYGTGYGDYIETGLTFTLPVNKGFVITSPFGVWRNYYRHTGTDFSGTGFGSPIYAIANGVVTQSVEWCGNNSCKNGTLGSFVVISHGNNYYTTYAHMIKGSLMVNVGDQVIMGQQIGKMGSTGRSSGAHLHLEFAVGEPHVGKRVKFYNAYKLIMNQ